VPSRADYTDVGGNGRRGEQGRRGTGGFDRTVEDAETDPYDVVTHGLRTS
jgi:hypothetical protein